MNAICSASSKSCGSPNVHPAAPITTPSRITGTAAMAWLPCLRQTGSSRGNSQAATFSDANHYNRPSRTKIVNGNKSILCSENQRYSASYG